MRMRAGSVVFLVALAAATVLAFGLAQTTVFGQARSNGSTANS